MQNEPVMFFMFFMISNIAMWEGQQLETLGERKEESHLGEDCWYLER